MSNEADWQHPDDITVYWRPGCGFCAGLLSSLERQGLQFARVDIWEEPEAAGFVRSVARGNETVPTVRVGQMAFVNPSPGEVLSAVADQVPDRLPDGWEPPQPGKLATFVGRLLGDGRPAG